MAEAQALREELTGRSKVIQRQAAELREKEQRVAAVSCSVRACVCACGSVPLLSGVCRINSVWHKR